jgi:hypothetical protein
MKRYTVTLMPRSFHPSSLAPTPTRYSARPTFDLIARLLTQPPQPPPQWASEPLDSLLAPPVPMAADTILSPPPRVSMGPIRRISELLSAVMSGNDD